MTIRVRLAAVLAASTALLLSACSGGASVTTRDSSADSSTLRMALTADLPTLDPSTVYQYEGNQVLSAVYEGLLQYASDGSTTIEPLLASAYTVSDDQKTYTFTIRRGATFSDGSAVTAEAVQQSFERLSDADVASQMSYMLAGVASYATPAEDTFVVTLKAPQSDFLSLIASPFGPKVINPAVLDDHADDDAKAYLADHVAGTGPYVLAEHTKGQQYVLERNEEYWGDAPEFETVRLSIIPSTATQLIQLKGGSLDIISGQPVATVRSLAQDGRFQVRSFPLLQKAQLHLKTTGALADADVRAAVRAAIDRPALVEGVWGSYATESDQMMPAKMLPAGSGTDTWTRSTSSSALSGVSLRLGYLGTQAQDEQAAETLQTQLEAAGAEVALVPTATADEVYGYSSDLEQAPDLFYEASYPDSTHPDTWARLFWYSTAEGGGVLNYLGGGSAAIDGDIDSGLSATEDAAVTADYAAAADAVHDQVGYITFADLQDTYVVREGLTVDGHRITEPKAIDLAEVTAS